MSSIPALPIRRALLAKTTPERNITTTPMNPRTRLVAKVKNMKTRAITNTSADQMQYRPACRYTVSERTRSAKSGSS